MEDLKIETEHSSCSIKKFDGLWILYNFYTEEEYRNQGFGTKLIEKVIDNFYNSSDTILIVRTIKGNTPYKIFEKLGFKILAENDKEHTIQGLLCRRVR